MVYPSSTLPQTSSTLTKRQTQSQSLPAAYKPSPLSYGSPRTSPFKRPDSPASSPFRRPESPSPPSPSPNPLNRPTTPQTQQQNPFATPSKLQNAPTPPLSPSGSWTPRGLGIAHTPSLTNMTTRDAPLSPTRSSSSATTMIAAKNNNNNYNNGNSPAKKKTPTTVAPYNSDALSKLPTSQVREMREGFQILDRDNDGSVNRDDVVDMLMNLGHDASPTTTAAQFFPPGSPQTLPLATFLATLASLLAPLSSPTELLNAFAAFDDHDSGEIDVGELKDALLHTAPEPGGGGEEEEGGGGVVAAAAVVGEREIDEVLGGFVGRRAFGAKEVRGGGGGGGGGRGEVFRYREWVGGLMDGGGGEDKKDGEK